MDDLIAHYIKARGASVWCVVVKGKSTSRTACDRDCSSWAFLAAVLGFAQDPCPNCESALATTIPAAPREAHVVQRHARTLIAKVQS